MADPTTCPSCGSPVPADAPEGACPKCLFQAGFATGGAESHEHVPTPEELQPRFPGLVIEELLGRGGMGVVYRARHKALDREVALKILPERVGRDRAFAERFQREARALAKLQHPNIVAVHDFGQSEGLFWLVMEYVDGTNIRQAMRAGQIGPREALAIVPQICDALQYAHEHGVVHRDIKPENVLLDRTGRVKVADFGLAKLMAHGPGDAALTGAGQVMGTPHYMAPEQVEHPTEVDHRADIYSLGVVFYEMLTGELPLGRFQPPSRKVEVDVRLDEVVLRSLEKEPARRYQQVVEVKTDVGRVTAGSAASADPRIEAAVQDLVGSVGKVVEGATRKVVDAAAKAGTVRVETSEGPPRRHDFHFQFDSDEEKARGGRLSKLAVAGALTVPLVVTQLVVVGLLRSTMGVDVPFGPVVLAGTLLVLAGWIASMVAWARIQRSGNRMRGRVWAALGTFLPVFAGCVAGPFIWYLGVRMPPRPWDNEFVDPTVAMSSSSELSEHRRQIEELWKRLLAVRGTSNLDEAYTAAGWAGIQKLPEDERRYQGASGVLGLPLMTAPALPEPLAGYRVESVSGWNVDPRTGRFTGAWVTLEGQDSVLHVPLVRHVASAQEEASNVTSRPISGWFFEVGQVHVER